ncbi:potassium channel family protein [Streptomyces sp. NPDC006463]|uniref:potassium channel family protein n=1 Tax=Streptomyces sp. NPDC006463 TaxID=3364746 RepID=UPI00368DDB9C
MERKAPGRHGPADASYRRRRRVTAGHLIRSLGSACLLTALYYLSPLDGGLDVSIVVTLALGLATFGGLVTWQIITITRSEYPRLRAIEALSTAVPLFLLLFSAAYYLLEEQAPHSFSEPLDRTDALYFTVTVFATVGFGDITPTTQTSRIMTTAQMTLDLILVGVIAKVLFSAVRIGIARRDTAAPAPGGEGDPPGGPSRGKGSDP